MLHHAAWDTLLIAKVSLGASAFVLNGIAAFTVHRRLHAIENDRTRAWRDKRWARVAN